MALPGAAQLSPVSAMSVADFDNDGLTICFSAKTGTLLGRMWVDLIRAGLILLGQGERISPVDSGQWVAILGENLNAVWRISIVMEGRYHRAADACQAQYYLGRGEARHPAGFAPDALGQRLGGTVR